MSLSAAYGLFCTLSWQHFKLARPVTVAIYLKFKEVENGGKSMAEGKKMCPTQEIGIRIVLVRSAPVQKE
jgi:hypothetical protein